MDRKRAHEVQRKQRRAAKYEKHCFSARMCNARYKESQDIKVNVHSKRI